MNHFWSTFDGFIKSSRFQIPSQFEYFTKGQMPMANVMLSFIQFPFGMSPDVPASKSAFLQVTVNFWIGVNEYYGSRH